jgi:hypothetical protein
LKTVETIQGGNFKCLTNGLYAGVGYGFRSRRRDTGDLDCAEEAMTECVGHQRADTFEVGDGRKFSLVHLTDTQVTGLIEQGVNGTIAETYAKFQIVEEGGCLLIRLMEGGTDDILFITGVCCHCCVLACYVLS